MFVAPVVILEIATANRTRWEWPEGDSQPQCRSLNKAHEVSPERWLSGGDEAGGLRDIVHVLLTSAALAPGDTREASLGQLKCWGAHSTDHMLLLR
ncbi:hypothetical protein DPEC_G00199800 [Dallia pectoralis]|uniref:Uncharacterized protein n=1 Tax=Dallia pectoralis TaxID=75939 RepID=A0ACC2G8U9_DALPE|nr:hypothetical protein DPEC_G00199800 [Dallia pectoralis]